MMTLGMVLSESNDADVLTSPEQRIPTQQGEPAPSVYAVRVLLESQPVAAFSSLSSWPHRRESYPALATHPSQQIRTDIKRAATKTSEEIKGQYTN
jgi:hypothetical protein